MSDSVFQLNSQVGQEFRKYKICDKNANEILQLRDSTVRVERELREKENARILLRRQSSLNVKNTTTLKTRTRNNVSRQQSFCQTTRNTSLKEIEFSIINLESQSIGLQCVISTLRQKYSNLEITDALNKEFVCKFMKIWREVKELEKRYDMFFNELPSTHEYNSHNNEIKTWTATLLRMLWEQKQEVTNNHETYKLKLKKKEEEQQKMLDNYYRRFEMKRDHEWEYKIRKVTYSPVESEFGSGMSSISSMSSVSSIGSQ